MGHKGAFDGAHVHKAELGAAVCMVAVHEDVAHNVPATCAAKMAMHFARRVDDLKGGELSEGGDGWKGGDG